VDSERELKSELRYALNEVLPPAPWLEATVIEDLRRRRSRATARSSRRPWISLPWPQSRVRLAAAVLVIVVAAAAGVYLVERRALTSPVPGGNSTPLATIVFGRIDANNNEYIFTIRPDGTGQKQLIAQPSGPVVWSHKGDRLALAAAGPFPNTLATAIVNADGSGYRVLPFDPSGLNLGPGRWSPDDSRIAFEGWNDANPSTNGIYTANVTDGGNRLRITTSPGGQHDVPIGYSPDGSKILFWRGPGDISQPGQLFVVAVDGGAVTQLSPTGMSVAGGFLGDAGSWSPDSTQISLAAASPIASDPGRSAVFVVAANGTNLKQITGWGDYITSARWSPTGTWIVFDKLPPAAAAHSLYLVHPDGTGTVMIPLLSAVCCAVWSPDGTRLLFTGGSGDLALDLWIVHIDGSGLVRLTNKPSKLTDIGWSSAA
jgi:Tol biopolymer transport system component